MARGLPLQLEWIIEKALEKDPNLRYQTIADMRVDLQRLKIALESGRLARVAADATAPAADAVVERELTDDSPEVVAVSGVSWVTRRDRRRRRPSCSAWRCRTTTSRGLAPTCRCSCRKARCITKARDTVDGFGYSGLGSRTSVTFIERSTSKTSRQWRACPRRATRSAKARRSRTGAPASRTPPVPSATSSLRPATSPCASIRKGQLVAFATGYATDGAIAHADRAKATSIGLEAIKKSFGIDASGYELEVVERSFPAGKTEMTWRSPALKYGHVEQLQVNLQGDRLILIERSLQLPRGYKEPPTPMAMRIFKGVGTGDPRRRCS